MGVCSEPWPSGLSANDHPHQLRHTLATQAINRGMSIEAIAAMLGHKSLDMTLVYAKIANRTSNADGKKAARAAAQLVDEARAETPMGS